MKRNRVRCLSCDEVIESKFGHDYRTCSCGKVSVDGGPCERSCRVVFSGPYRRVEDDDSEGPAKEPRSADEGVER